MGVSNIFAIWDWEREPQPPSARVVVCRPGGGTVDSVTTMMAAARRGIQFVQPSGEFPSQRLPAWLIPALYAERQADLAGVGALLAVQSERRALVLCPREAVDLRGCLPQLHWTDPRIGLAERPVAWGAFDLVVIIPPPEASACEVRGACEACRGSGTRTQPTPWGCTAHRCETCNGAGRIEPWPMHAAWVKGIVEQCHAAGVPVADLTSDEPSEVPAWLTNACQACLETDCNGLCTDPAADQG